MENARYKRADSHIFKHWSNQHAGRETKFSFKILNFFAAPLERQVGEAVRIARTGASTILNSKSVYNRNPLPRIIARDVVEPTNLGDMVDQEGRESNQELEPVPKMKKQMRQESYRDLLNWGAPKKSEEVGATANEDEDVQEPS